MKFNLKNRPETLTPEQHKSGNYLWVNPTKAAEWFEGFEKELREKFDDDDFFGPIFGSKLTDFKDLKLRFYKLQGWIIDLKKEILGEAEQ